VSEGEAKCPFAHPELFEPIFCRWSNAATVVRWVIIQFAERIGRDGKLTANERSLLMFLQAERPAIDPQLRELIEKAATVAA
jgi:hypothetical protein